MLNKPVVHLAVGPGTPDGVFCTGVIVVDHLHELVALETRFTLDDVVRYQPVVELRVGP